MGKERALLIVDLQNDFCFGGALEVPGADQIVDVVNMLQRDYSCIIATQDWHPEGHFSFASTHEGKEPFETIPWRDGLQVLWPDHCTAGTDGAAFHPDLDTDGICLILRKGMDPLIDSYSAFFENDHTTPTGLEGLLRSRGITSLDICGLATDYCVHYTALDALACGFSVRILIDAVRGLDQPKGSLAEKLRSLEALGASLA